MKQNYKKRIPRVLKLGFLLSFLLVQFFGFGNFSKVYAVTCTMTTAWGDQNHRPISSPPTSVTFPQTYSALVTFQNCVSYGPSVILEGPTYGTTVGTTVNLGSPITQTTETRWAPINLTQAGGYFFMGNASNSNVPFPNSDIYSSRSSTINATASNCTASNIQWYVKNSGGTNSSISGAVTVDPNKTYLAVADFTNCQNQSNPVFAIVKDGSGLGVPYYYVLASKINQSSENHNATVAFPQPGAYSFIVSVGTGNTYTVIGQSPSIQVTLTANPGSSATGTTYACPSLEANPVWTCSKTNNNTCNDVTGCVAGSCTQVQVSQCGKTTASSPAPASPAGGQPANSVTELINPIEGYTNLTALLVNIMKGFLGIIGVWAVAFIVIGGFKMVISSGNEEAVLAARKTITWAVLGLLAAVLSFAIIAIVQNLIGVQVPASTTTQTPQGTPPNANTPQGTPPNGGPQGTPPN